MEAHHWLVEEDTRCEALERHICDAGAHTERLATLQPMIFAGYNREVSNVKLDDTDRENTKCIIGGGAQRARRMRLIMDHPASM